MIRSDHRWGFPCCYWSTLHVCRRHYPGRSDGPRSLVLSHRRRPSRLHGGLAPALIVSRPAQRSLPLRPACSPITYVTSAPEAPTVSSPPPPLRLLPGGANPVPGRDFHPQSTSAFSRRTRNRDFSPTIRDHRTMRRMIGRDPVSVAFTRFRWYSVSPFRWRIGVILALVA